MHHLFSSCFSLAALALLALPASTRASDPSPITPAQLRALAKETFDVLPDRMPGADKDTAEQIALGRKLFFDTRLSDNRTQSCNTCHQVDNDGSGADDEPTSPGAFGKRGGRNSPTVLNAGFHFAQFWDGRAATLEEQAKGPILNPIEMAMPTEVEVLRRVRTDQEYPAMFAKAFPQTAPQISYDAVARAIAAFERTLITRDRFDDFLRGDDKALSAMELRGLQTFMDVGCGACHNGPVFGANTFQKMGLINAYENTTDLGRFEVTKDDSDKFKFKVASLRNIALTSPYFHDGAVASLSEAVRKMAWLQLSRELTDGEIRSVVAFLQTLSDKQRARRAPPTASPH